MTESPSGSGAMQRDGERRRGNSNRTITEEASNGRRTIVELTLMALFTVLALRNRRALGRVAYLVPLGPAGYLLNKLRAEVAAWWSDWQKRRHRVNLQFWSELKGAPCMKLGTPAKPSKPRWPWSPGPDRWNGFCPICKRPFIVQLCDRLLPYLPWVPPNIEPAPEAKGKCAFLICLWGASPTYLVGAMVLGYSIKLTKSRHKRVCLYTSDVPQSCVELLKKLWDCRLIEHIKAETQVLSWSDPGEGPDRFEKVFTKLRGMQLVEFEKVLMMDIDMLVRTNIDELFNLRAPAAMRRGMNERFPNNTGDLLKGDGFFSGKDDSKWCWGQGSGINAGVMLWQPNEAVFQSMHDEITDPKHPEHCRGNGPEQDYLSRYWADAPWTHIGVEYNFQLHQMYYALHPDRVGRTQRSDLLMNHHKIKIVHYSGEATAKPWNRVLDEKWADWWPDRSKDAEYMEKFAEEFQGHHQWVKRDPAWFERRGEKEDMEGIYIGEDGEIYRRPKESKPVCNFWKNGSCRYGRDCQYAHEEPRSTADQPEKLIVPKEIKEATSVFLQSVLDEWFNALQRLEEELQMDLPSTFKRRVAEAKEQRNQQPDVAQGSAPVTAVPTVFSSRTAGRVKLSKPSWWRSGTGNDIWHTDVPKEATSKASKVTVSCGIGLPESGSPDAEDGESSSIAFVRFVEDGRITVNEQGEEAFGVHIKVLGSQTGRHWRLSSEDDVSRIQLWVGNQLSPPEPIMLSIVGVKPPVLQLALQALQPLGVPQEPPPAAKVFAAIGQVREGGGAPICNSHASQDMAYTSMTMTTDSA